MKIHIVAVGRRMPRWVSDGYNHYAARMPAHCRFELIEVAPGRRTPRGRPEGARREEGERLLRAVPARARRIALDRLGVEYDTRALAGALETWLAGGRDVALLIGGADGLAQACLDRCEARWSLSRLTLAHPLVRVVVAEQLYRAWTLLQGHPYHRD